MVAIHGSLMMKLAEDINAALFLVAAGNATEVIFAFWDCFTERQLCCLAAKTVC